jgi:hypothetical protein
MKKLNQFCLFIILSFLIQHNIYPQNIWDEIQQKVNVQFGDIYGVSDIQNVDENKNKYFDERLEFTDPYNTLQNCYLFLASSNNPHGSEHPKGFLAIYKNGSIIWNSDPVINTESVDAQYIKGTMEINDDGKVEIITSWYSGMQGQDKYIWIFSWDGNNGYLINDTTDQGGESVIWTEDEKPNLIDLNGDGILEIIGLDVSSYDNDEEKYSPLVYSWNGSKYGNYGMQIPQYAPKNLLTVKVNCKVTPSQYGSLFNYTVKNDSTSKQSIELFAVEKPFEYAYAGSTGPTNKWNAYSSNNWNLFVWDVNIDLQKFPFDYLSPGEVKSNFRLESATPIIFIGNYYVQGKNGDSSPDDQYIFENSFNGVTICGTNPPDPFVPSDFLDTLLNYNQRSSEIGWITNQTTADKYDSLFNTAKTQLQQNNNNTARTTLQTLLQEVDIDSTNNLTSEAYALLRHNTEYLLEQIPQSSPNLLVNLSNSLGTQIPASNVKYYDTSWKDAADNGDGTFTVITTKPTVSVRMFYEGANQTVNNVPAQNNTYTFQTVNAAVELTNSLGSLIDEGTVQYYAGAWRSFGTTVNGVANKELLPKNYSFRMTYEYGSIDKQQDISVNPTVVFQTVNAAIELRNSTGALIDEGTVQYYAGAWRSFDTTVNGVAYKELLPKNYSFRMTYEYGSIDKQQDISVNPTVVFQTVNAAVELRNSLGNLIDEGTVQYYADAWRSFGTTINGVANKELLPKNYSFRMTYEYVSNDKQQDLSTNSTVTFSTVLCMVKVTNANNQPLEGADTKYYSGAWRDIGLTNANGEITKELLPKNLSFRAIYGSVSQDKQQDIGVNSLVEIQLNTQ